MLLELHSLLGISNQPAVLPYAATITPDAGRGSYFRVTLSGNVTINPAINLSDGQQLLFEIIQGATARTASWDPFYAFGSLSGTLTATANKRDFFSGVYDAAANKIYMIGAAKGY